MIKGFFKGDFGFVNAHLISEVAGIDETIEFAIDTGAAKTVVLDKDAVTLGINYNKLRRYERDFVGIGGSIETYAIEDATLFFKSEKGDVEVKTPVFVLRHRLKKMVEDERAKILRLPSLLGRDVINRFRLVFDSRKQEIIFEFP